MKNTPFVNSCNLVGYLHNWGYSSSIVNKLFVNIVSYPTQGRPGRVGFDGLPGYPGFLVSVFCKQTTVHVVLASSPGSPLERYTFDSLKIAQKNVGTQLRSTTVILLSFVLTVLHLL